MIATMFTRPRTATGVDESTKVPSPNSPLLLSPQHAPVPLASKTQECNPSAVIATALVIPFTATGVDDAIKVPFPS